MRVYVDLVALWNFSIDLLLLLSANRLCGHPPGLRRALPAAALGGVYSGLCLLPGFRFLGGWLWRGVFLVLLCLLAFGFHMGTLRRGGLFLLLSMALGGMSLALAAGGRVMPLAASGALWLLCRLSFRGSPGQRVLLPLGISHRGVTLRLTALKDTGNDLRDPITGEQVLIIGSSAARQLTGLRPEQLRQPVQTMAERPLPGLRLIPCRTVQDGAGMLLAMRFPQVTLGNRKRSAIVAFSPVEVGAGDEYQALLGGGME